MYFYTTHHKKLKDLYSSIMLNMEKEKRYNKEREREREYCTFCGYFSYVFFNVTQP